MNALITESLPNEIVLASAGSGKTYRLSNRVIGLIMRGVEPRAIAALTFTKKAAGEFADAILQKLAEAAGSEEDAQSLAAELKLAGLTRSDFAEALSRVVAQLPEMFMGTLDSFFARVVRCFQYELGLSGGAFEMIQGDAVQVIVEDLLAEILRGDELTDDERADFHQAFKLATLGKEEAGVRSRLRDFVEKWHAKRLDVPSAHAWGNSEVAFGGEAVTEQALESRRAALQDQLEALLPAEEAFQKWIEQFRSYAIGSGGLNELPGVMKKFFAEWDEIATGGVWEVKYGRKNAEVVTLDSPTMKVVVELVTVLATHEAYVRLVQTSALWAVMDGFEKRYDERVRTSGRLTFNDLKIKMSAWAKSEMDRVRREQVDFRLDGRYDQWLLDEFQDTSEPQWLGVQPLVDEVAFGEEMTTGEGADEMVRQRGFFVVGDKKQGIYAWRGGDPRLFDVVMDRYEVNGQKTYDAVAMAESWRSQEPLLGLVNCVFGQLDRMAAFFPKESIARWQWDEHSTAKAKKTEPAYATVRQVEGRGDEGEEQRIEALLEIVAEVDPVRRGISCGLLFRGNKAAAKVAETLRDAGYPVAENGVYKPGQDSPVGRAVVDLLLWLENPADDFASTHVRMAGLVSDAGEDEWQRLRAEVVELGWAGMMRQCFADHQLSDFGKSRFERLMELIEQGVVSGLTTAGDLAQHLHGNESPTDEMEGALQVMTIHKSKGLGFDMVILPELSDKSLEDAGKFKTCQLQNEAGEVELLTQTPSSWARKCLPVYAEAERLAEAQRVYEDLCVLYVAMTRAKRGMYVLMDGEGDKLPMSYATWLRTILPGGGGDEGQLYEAGQKDWFAGVTPKEVVVEGPLPELPALKGRAKRRQASHTVQGVPSAEVLAGLEFGNEVHAIFEGISWLTGDELFPDTPAGDVVAACVANAEVRDLLRKPEGEVTLFREQGFEQMIDGAWATGIVDRLHLFGPVDEPERLQIIDYKTDVVSDADELRHRHAAQLEVYRRAVTEIFQLPVDQVECVLVSTSLGQLIRL